MVDSSPLPDTPEPGDASGNWVRPDYEVISLDCEITAYAPDGGDPLF